MQNHYKSEKNSMLTSEANSVLLNEEKLNFSRFGMMTMLKFNFWYRIKQTFYFVSGSGMKMIITTLVLLPFIAFAQGGELTVGQRTVSYDSATTTAEGTLYYGGDDMVASTNGEVTLVYENGVAVLEAHDTNGDGTLDAFLTLDENGEVTNMTGEGVDAFKRPEVKEFAELVAEGGGGEAAAPDTEDLVGDLDSITIPRYHNYTLYLWLLILAGGGYWYYHKRQKGNK